MVVLVSDLSAYLLEHLGDRVADDIVREADRQGHKIDRTVVYNLLAGRHAKRPRQATLDALAAGFGNLDIRTLRELTGRPPGELGPYIPTQESASLTHEQRDALDQLIKAIVGQGVGDVGSTRQKMIEGTGGGDAEAEPVPDRRGAIRGKLGADESGPGDDPDPVVLEDLAVDRNGNGG